MADHFASLNRGESGTKESDFTFGTSSAATDVFELRILDGAGVTKKDALIALKAFERLIENPQWCKDAGFDVSG